MKRRNFLKYTIPSVLLPSFLGGLSIKAIASSSFLQSLADSSDDHVLVLIQLNGGNDGLNTVIPLEFYDNYHKARENIAIPEDKVLKLSGNDKTGLHPSMTALRELFDNGNLSIIQAVSYPKPNFSHFRATDIWLTAANSTEILTTGWMGRYLDQQFPDFPQSYPNAKMPDPLAIQVGSIVSPGLQGPNFTMGMAISNTNGFYQLLDEHYQPSEASRAEDQLNYIKAMSQKTDQYSAVIKAAAQKVPKQSDKYPASGKNSLADQLKIVARLIAGGLKTKIYMVSLGGFDTHAKQTDAADTTVGNHASLLGKLSEAVGAFMDDLKYLQVNDRVLGMTFSEFGRRIKSNDSGGTDHGAAAPVFVFGSKVKPGIIGNNPPIASTITVNDNIAMQSDFRSVYATFLNGWLGMQKEETRKVLMGEFAQLPVV